MTRIVVEGFVVSATVVLLAVICRLIGKRDGAGFHLYDDLFITWEVLTATAGLSGTAWAVGQYSNPQVGELAHRGLVALAFVAVISIGIAIVMRFGGYDKNTGHVKKWAFWWFNLLGAAVLLLAVLYIYVSIAVEPRHP